MQPTAKTASASSAPRSVVSCVKPIVPSAGSKVPSATVTHQAQTINCNVNTIINI